MKRFICILLASVMGLCCFSCTDDESSVYTSMRYYIWSIHGSTVYSYRGSSRDARLTVDETYILEVVYLESISDGSNREKRCPDNYETWIEECDENYLQITRRYDLDNDFGLYYELKPIGESADASFVIFLGNRDDEKSVKSWRAYIQIVA